MATFSLVMLLTITFSIFFIGLLIFIKKPKNRRHQYFFGMSFFLSIWMVANYYQNELQFNQYLNIFFLRLDFATAVFIVYFLLLFSLRFPYKLSPYLWKIELALLVPTLALSAASFSQAIIKNINFVENQIGFDYGPYYFLYAIQIFSFATASIVTLIYKFIKNKGIERIQILYIIIGFSIAFANAITINILLQNIIPLELFRFGIYGFVFLIGFTAYAVLKHHLMDIKVIATEALTFIILFILLVEALLSETWAEFILRQLFFAVVALLGFFLIRSVIKEVNHGREMEALAKKLADANAKLRKLDQSKTEFISIASHQLRTPLSITKGYISMILEGNMGKINSKIRDALTKINKSNEHLINLVETLLNISRIETGRIEFNFKKKDLVDFIENIIGQFEMQIKGQDMNIKVTSLNNLPEFVVFDDDKIGEVLINLIDNAIKYGQKGSIDVTLENKNGVVEICVIDHGIGIKKDDLDDIFMKFKRGVNASATEVHGSGLGLFICRKLVEAHGGKIWAESKGPGKGAKFCIHLPKDPREVVKHAKKAEA